MSRTKLIEMARHNMVHAKAGTIDQQPDYSADPGAPLLRSRALAAGNGPSVPTYASHARSVHRAENGW